MARKKDLPKITLEPENETKGISLISPVYRESMGKVSLLLYMQLTEQHTPEDWQRLENKELTPGQRAIKENVLLTPLLLELRLLFQLSSYNTMLQAYKAGKISEPLKEILLHVPATGIKADGDGRFYSEELAAVTGNTKEFEHAVVNGDLDFSPFKRADEKERLWFLLYRIAPNPIPGYYGSIANWDKKPLGDKTVLEAEHADIKAETKKIVTEALQGGVEPAAIIAIADELKAAYDKNTKAGRLNVWNGLYKYGTEFETGFVVDLKQRKIFDLRPYTDELVELLEPGFEPLKEFAQALKRYVKEYQKKQLETPLFDDGKAVVMFNSPQTNMLVNLTTYHGAHGKNDDGTPKVPDKWKRKGILQQNIFTEQWEYEDGYLNFSLPVKYAPPEEMENRTPEKLTPEEMEKYFLPPQLGDEEWRLLHFSFLKFSLQNGNAKETGAINLRINTTVRQIMQAMHKKITPQNVKTFGQRVKKSLEILAKFQLNKVGKTTLNFKTFFSSVDMKNGEIEIDLALKLAEHLIKSNMLMTYVPALLALKGGNPNAYPLGYYLCVRASNDNNIKRGTSNIISVEKALQNCPGIPSIETVKKQRNSAEVRIITPFENTLNKLLEQNVLESWEYCLSKGEKLKEPDVCKYDYFKTLYIKFKIKGLVVNTERIEANEAKKREAEERKKKYKAIAKKKKLEAEAKKAE